MCPPAQIRVTAPQDFIMFLPFLLPERTSEVVFWLFLLRQKKKKKP